jgi:hypothetical protein
VEHTRIQSLAVWEVSILGHEDISCMEYWSTLGRIDGVGANMHILGVCFDGC